VPRTFAVDAGLEIRLLEDGHAADLFRITNLNRQYLRQWLPWVDKTTSVEHVRGYIARVLEAFHHNELFSGGIWYQGRLHGGIGWHKVDWENRKTALGYWLDASLQGRGIVTRCCQRLIDYLVDEVKLHRLEIHCATGNTKSCAIPQRLGFRREGVLREAEWVNDRFVDLVAWSMLAREWRERRLHHLPPKG
jgi:ribosomal-protein-serine acetyltransferase